MQKHLVVFSLRIRLQCQRIGHHALCNHDSYLDQLTGRLGGRFVKALFSLFSEHILWLCCRYEKVDVSGVLSPHVRFLCRVAFFWYTPSTSVLFNVNTNCEHTQRM